MKHKRKRKETSSEALLMQQIIKGNSIAFENLFRMYYQQLINYAIYFVKELSVAENTVQDIFLKIWINKINLSSGLVLKTYLYKAVRNRSIDYLRHLNVRDKCREDVCCYSCEKSPEEILLEQERVDILFKEIEKLPHKCKTIFVLRSYKNFSYAEIAKNQNISKKTVEYHFLKAKKILKNRSY